MLAKPLLIVLLLCSSFAVFAQQDTAQQSAKQPASDLNQALASSRQRIDSIDDEIVKLLNERAQIVRQVGAIKKKYNAPASAPGREEQVLRRVAAKAEAPLTAPAVEAIFRTILHEMSAMEATDMERGPKAP